MTTATPTDKQYKKHSPHISGWRRGHVLWGYSCRSKTATVSSPFLQKAAGYTKVEGAKKFQKEALPDRLELSTSR
jgi:hypothetical protein